MTRNQVAASVAKRKEQRPEEYCPQVNCLWRTGGGYCPRHQPSLNAHVHPVFSEILSSLLVKK